MTRVLTWLWNRGVVSTFLTGLFVVLPVIITLGIMGWIGRLLKDWLGPESYVGQALSHVGVVRYVTHPAVVTLIGWAIVVAVIWFVGVLVITTGRNKLDRMFRTAMERIPVINIIYKPVAQVVDMFKQAGPGEMEGMRVVYCRLGGEHGAGLLGLLASKDVYRFAGQDCHIVYVPTSPVPMSGGVIFVPVDAVHKVDMHVDDLMQIYFSIGVMSTRVVPKQYVKAKAAG